MTPKQKKFCEELMVDENATQAMIRAGYSAKFAGTNADKLLKNTNVAAYIAQLRAEIRERSRLTVDDLIYKLEKVVTGGPTETISGANYLEAIDKLMKRHGGYAPERKHVTGEIESKVKVEQSAKRDYSNLSLDELKQLRELELKIVSRTDVQGDVES